MYRSLYSCGKEFVIENRVNRGEGQDQFGLSESEFSQLKDLVIDPLKKNGATVWIFGSRAMGTHRYSSDVDILYQFPQNLKPRAGFFFLLKETLSESRFPFTIDLVDVHDLAKTYRDRVLKERKSI